ncbi:MAG: phage head closure protein, partial [Pseudolabrys sp.]|nr:phage head closure protein [Pseudolabrys sp.]
MTTFSLQAGDLDRRLVLEAPAEADDGAGGVTRGYAAVATVWAQLAPLAAHAETIAGSLGAVVTHRIVIRAGRDVTTFHRFRDGTRIFRVVATRERDSGRFVDIDAEQRED